MIRVKVNGGRTVHVEGLAPGTIAYFDAAWLPSEEADVPAIVLDSSVEDPDAAAATALRAVAGEAVGRVPEGAGPVEVLGDGLVAEEARRLLPPGVGDATRPRCAIDTTGDPETIAAALAELDDLGTLVAAGPLGSRAFPVNLYEHVHLRGLTIAGVAPPLSGGVPAASAGADAPRPVEVRPGAPLGAGQWFRLEA